MVWLKLTRPLEASSFSFHTATSEERVSLTTYPQGLRTEDWRQETDTTLESHLSYSVDVKGKEPLAKHNRSLRGHRVTGARKKYLFQR